MIMEVKGDGRREGWEERRQGKEKEQEGHEEENKCIFV
jgi:hypothetical protein